MEESVYRRFETIMFHKNLTQKQLGELCGLTQQGLAGMKRNESFPNGRVFMNVANNLPDISLIWLLTGQGEMWSTPPPTTKKEYASNETENKVEEPVAGYATAPKAEPKSEAEDLASIIVGTALRMQEELVRLRTEVSLLRQLLNDRGAAPPNTQQGH